MEIKSVGVMGVGVMGSGIAQSLAVAGYEVHMNDLDQSALDKARDRMENSRYGLKRSVELGKLSAEEAKSALDRVSGNHDIEVALGGVDLVVEAVFEDFGLKIKTFRRLDQVTPPHVILTSNTSGFSITALAAATDRPDRVIGWHWASPSYIMKMAEIIIHDGTSDEVRDTVVDLAIRCGKNPQVVKDQPFSWGFVGNRIAMAMRREAERVVAEGLATEEQVDAILKDQFRWPTGPFEIAKGARQGWE